MIPGDLVKITSSNDSSLTGLGIYLGIGKRGKYKDVFSVLWYGRITTFDMKFWLFEVI